MMGPTDGHQPSASIPLLADAIALSRHREQFSTNISHIKCPTPLQGSIRMPERLPSEMVPPMLDLPNRSLPQCYVNEHFGPEVFHIYNIGPACLFNKIRTDTKHRKRAFTKRGYFRQSRSILRKENRMKFAYALQGIDYEMLESLKMGEIPDIRDYKR
ncbi:hypothetical protein BaOVIS_010870 [Babesia ovis]|uniref:Uncharacterized protein n=1 Tax=Babesia ovis TaxID=5869 RepID=A0A9W5WU94_BABOV|nr:hypothetical protein BaOVIS_010870 [Babesia ovis]